MRQDFTAHREASPIGVQPLNVSAGDIVGFAQVHAPSRRTTTYALARPCWRVGDLEIGPRK